MELGKAVKLMRTASGLKQKEVASRIGVTSNYVSLVEGGKREPSVSFLRKLAEILRVPVGLFFLWDEAAVGVSKQDLGQLRSILGQLQGMYLFASRRKPRRRQAT
jgi:transcriptional regulator with XRE-family HTH domain